MGKKILILFSSTYMIADLLLLHTVTHFNSYKFLIFYCLFSFHLMAVSGMLEANWDFSCDCYCLQNNLEQSTPGSRNYTQ